MNRFQNEMKVVAKGLGDFLPQVMFVGGTLPVFYVDPEFYREARPTEDVDCIVEVTSRLEMHKLEESLRERGFQNSPELIVRWIYQGIVVDIMPLDEKIFGFSNYWYKEAFLCPREEVLSEGIACKILSLPYFLATKFEAIEDRGGEDLRTSKDLEDVVFVVNGCRDVVQEVLSSNFVLQKFLSEESKKLLKNPLFHELLEVNLSRAMISRMNIIEGRFKELAEINTV